MTLSLHDVQWGNPVSGLRLGIAVTAKRVVVSIENVGDKPIKVASHIAAHERHYDYFSLMIASVAPGAQETPRRLHLSDDRDKSAPVFVTLGAGERLQHEIDVPWWSARSRNRSQVLAAGTYRVRAIYKLDPGEADWSGTLESGAATLIVS